jgi:hypothetical protein
MTEGAAGLMGAVAKPASAAETLRAARALIEDPKHWTKGVYAATSKRSAEWSEVFVGSERAVCWCSLGALRRVDGPHEDAARGLLADAINPQWRTQGEYPYVNEVIYRFNDARHRRHREVLAKFDEAIALAEAQEQAA